MPTHPLFKILESVDSTNNYAMQNVRAGLAKHGSAWFTRDQTAGKGQRGREWQSQPGQNIALSIVVQPLKLKPEQQFLLSMTVSLAVHHFFNQYAKENTTLKWPNDLYWRDRKAGGILIENVFQGTGWKWAIIGIGLNINQENFGRQLKNPVSLTLITKKIYDTAVLAEELYLLVLKYIAQLETMSVETLTAQYNACLYKKNEQVKLKASSRTFVTTVKNVDARGVLHTFDTMEREFEFGEVEWIAD